MGAPDGDELIVPGRIADRMLDEARRALPDECCGLLGGKGNRVVEIYPASNRLNTPTTFEIAPRELFDMFRNMREAGLEHVGIYHSHPSGENVPSPRDTEMAYYPEAAFVVISPSAGAARPIRAFRLVGRDWKDVPVRSGG